MKNPRSKRYSEAFKRQLVRDIERGKITAREAQRKYGIAGNATIHNWLRKFGGKKSVSTKAKQTPQDVKLERLKRQNRELEQAVARLTVEKVALQALIDEAEAELGLDMKKTFGMGR